MPCPGVANVNTGTGELQKGLRHVHKAAVTGAGCLSLASGTADLSTRPLVVMAVRLTQNGVRKQALRADAVLHSAGVKSERRERTQ